MTLELSEITTGVRAPELRLIDREQGTSTLLDQPPEGLRYRIVSFGPRPYRLAIVAGSNEYVEKATQEALTIPARVTLDPNAPNPFRMATRIRFGLPRSGQVTLEVFSVLGQRVAAPLEGVAFPPGFHTAIWDGTTSNGAQAPSGVYLIRLLSGGTTLTRRVILMR
jgi:hypothetical protein